MKATITETNASILRANAGKHYVYSYLPQLKEVIPDSDPSGRHVWADETAVIWSNLGVVVDNTYFGERTSKEQMTVI